MAHQKTAGHEMSEKDTKVYSCKLGSCHELSRAVAICRSLFFFSRGGRMMFTRQLDPLKTATHVFVGGQLCGLNVGYLFALVRGLIVERRKSLDNFFSLCSFIGSFFFFFVVSCLSRGRFLRWPLLSCLVARGGGSGSVGGGGGTNTYCPVPLF